MMRYFSYRYIIISIGVFAFSFLKPLHAKVDSSLFEIPEGHMTLSEAFQIALENNPGIDQIESRVKNAEATISRAKSYLFPVLGISATKQYANAVMQPDWNPAVRAEMDFNQLDAGVSFNWLIYNGLQEIHYLRAAKSGLEGARQQHLNAQRVLLGQVSQAFIQSELAKEQMRIAKSRYEFNKKLESDAQLRFDVGEIPEANVLNFSLALLQAESDFERAAHDYKIACTIIAQLLSIEGSSLSSEQLPVSNLDRLAYDVPEFEELLGVALVSRPDLRAVAMGIESMQHQVKALNGSYLPSVSFFGGMRYKRIDDAGTIDQDEHDSNVGLQFRWLLFNGGRRKAQILEMIEKKNELSFQQQQLFDSISSEIRQRMADLETSHVLLEKSIMAEGHARKIRDFVEKSYLAGSASITRLNEAQNNWVRSSSMLAAARLQILLNQYKLQTATGEIVKQSYFQEL